MYGGINIHHFDMLEIIGKGTYAKVVLVKKIVRIISLFKTLGHETNICSQNIR